MNGLFRSWCPGNASTLCLITSPGLKYGEPPLHPVSDAPPSGFTLMSVSLSSSFSSSSWRLVVFQALVHIYLPDVCPSVLSFLFIFTSPSQGPSVLFNYLSFSFYLSLMRSNKMHRKYFFCLQKVNCIIKMTKWIVWSTAMQCTKCKALRLWTSKRINTRLPFWYPGHLWIINSITIIQLSLFFTFLKFHLHLWL